MHNFNKPITLFILALCLLPTWLQAQQPVVKLDMNMSGRREAETNEPGYTPWIPDNEQSTSKTVDGITFTFEKVGEVGEALRANWYKAGIQAPYYARLGGDAVYVDGGDAGAQIRLTISGLEAGTHSLLTYHNGLSSKQCAPLDISLNGSQVVDNLSMPLRATEPTSMAINYLTFEVEEGNDVELLFQAVTTTDDLIKNVYICGIELNTPNFLAQATTPFPEDRSAHDVEPGTVALNWEPAPDAVAHHVYFGTDETAVHEATIGSSAYRGQQNATTHSESNLSIHETYFWRIDEVNSNGETTKGNVWSFRPRRLAFPGAEGYGRFAIGGRGGKVVHVTNLADNGPGSLRDAVENHEEPRTIVFDVSGTIELESRLVLNDPFVTVAGQTAPGKGICIRSAPFGFTGNDVIARFVRLRLGAGPTYDGMGLTGANHSILDHCSISWTIDESFSSRGANNITLQRTLISEALNAAGHKNYPEGTEHGYAATIGGDIGSFHHNLLAHNYGRNWSMGGGLDGNAYYSGRLDITNNVVYNWGNRTTDGGAHEVNFINNYYKPGPGTTHFIAMTIDHEGTGLGTQRGYFSGNVMPGHFNEENQEAGRQERYSNGDYKQYEGFVDSPFFPSHMAIQPAREAYKNVLSDVGANQPFLDDHDHRMINETLAGSYSVVGSETGKKGFPDHQDDAGGYEVYPFEQRDAQWDSDGDGLPNWWEEAIGTSPNSVQGDFSNANADQDGDGYTALEEYLHWMANVHFRPTTGTNVNVHLPALFKGYTLNPSYSTYHVDGGSVDIEEGTATFTPERAGFSTISFMVIDEEGSSMVRDVEIYIPEMDITALETTDVTCYGEKNGSIEVMVSGSLAPYQVSLDGETFEASTTLDSLTAGDYDVHVRDAIGNIKTLENITIHQPEEIQALTNQPETLYLGYQYQPQELRVEQVTGGAAPYSYEWNTGQTGSSITVSPEVTTEYELTVTDASGCQKTQSITVEVVDVRCGNGSGKVTLCHKGKVKCIAPQAVESLLKNGATLGACNEATKFTNNSLKVSPNPARTMAELDFESAIADQAMVRIIDAFGTVVQEYELSIHEGENQFPVALGHLRPGFHVVMISGSAEEYNQVKIFIE
ncbi:T9SS C-terminal target domain-containing protein [Echinicola soli]|uniref:T9SS C-terminal target domain-containing protein n=1 Tax=Echinicola soli TaxID=2591634 RepID=UPI00143D0351|nr:T9SS C-terminal target domain-containing protein [Echinicola soli]